MTNRTSSTRYAALNTRALQAMVWKEWRENLKWALAMCAALSALLFYMVWQASNNQRDNELINLWQSTQPLLMFVMPLLAGVLGFVQVNSELRRDQWAFLVHRPTTRNTLFWGKALAGLSLYALFASLPYLGFCWWMSAPGNVPAPFDWRLAWPGFLMLSLGVVFYFAGMLTAIRAKPWFGSRALAVAASLWCVLLLGNSWFVWIVIFGALIVVAAHGSFMVSGRFRGQSRVAQWALSSTLFAGFVVVAGFVLGIVSSLSFFRDASPMTMRDYIVTEKGTVFQTENANYGVTYSNADASIADLKGKIVARGAQTDAFNKANRQLRFSEIDFKSSFPVSPLTNAFSFYFDARSDFYRSADVYWFFDRIHNYLVGYSLRTRAVAGYIGANGFYLKADLVKPFDEVLVPSVGYQQPSNLLHFVHSIYLFDQNKRSVRLAFRSTRRIVGATQTYFYGYDDKPKKVCLAALTDDNVLHVVTEQGKTLWTHQLAIEEPDSTQLLLAQTRSADRFYVWLKPYRDRVAQPQILTTFSTQGEIVQQQTLPILASGERAPNPLQNVFITFAPPVTMAIYGVYALGSGQSWAQIANDISSGGAPEMVRATTLFLRLSFLFAIVAAFFTYRRATRYAFASSTRYAWTIAVLLLGPLGLPLMIALLDWPAREKCASCGKMRVVNREKCAHCDSSFAKPLPDGTEIFGEVETRELAVAN